MAGHRPLMVFRDSSRDRVVIQQQQQSRHATAPITAAGFQMLHSQYSRAQQFDVKEDEINRMRGRGDGGTAWAAMALEHQQRAAAAAAALHRQRVVTSRPPLPHIPTSLIHQGVVPGQGVDWDGPGRLASYDPVSSGRFDRDFLIGKRGRLDRDFLIGERGRLDRDFLIGESGPLERDFLIGESGRLTESMGMVRGGLPGGISRDVFEDLSIRNARDEMFRERELAETVHPNFFDEARDRIEMSRAYQRFGATQQLESPGRFQGPKFSHEESGHAELFSRYGGRSSSRNLEMAHAAIATPVQATNFSKKRFREEEEDFDRERLLRHRRLSGIDSPPRVRLHGPVQKMGNHQTPAEYKQFRFGFDDREEGQPTPTSPITSRKSPHFGVQCKTQLFRHEDDLRPPFRSELIPRKEEVHRVRYPNVMGFPSRHDSPPSSRAKSASTPSTARENGSVFGIQFKPLVQSRDQPWVSREQNWESTDQSLVLRDQTLVKRERLRLHTFKDNERSETRGDRVWGNVESYSCMPSDSFGMSRKNNKEFESHSRLVNSKAVDRVSDVYQFKRQQQLDDTPQGNSRARPNHRKSRMGGEILDDILAERYSKESSQRSEKDLMRKASALKDGKQVRELTISVQKHGQRTVKVEEYGPRDSNCRSGSRSIKEERFSRREGTRLQKPSSDSHFSERDRLSAVKKRNCDGRSAAASLEKPQRPQSSKNGTACLQLSSRSLAQDRASLSSDRVKNDNITLAAKYDTDSQRQQSIFLRLGGSNRDASSTCMRIVAETSRQETSVPNVDDQLSVPSSSKKLPNATLQVSACDGPLDDIVDFQGFSTGMDTESSRVVEFGCKDTGNFFVFDTPFRIPVESADIFSKPSLSFVDDATREELERRPEVLQMDLRLHKPGQSMPRAEGMALPIGDTGIHYRVPSLETRIVEFHTPFLGNGFKPIPKLIATGHKKDQVLKKSLFSVDDAEHGNSSLIAVDVAPGETAGQEYPARKSASTSPDKEDLTPLPSSGKSKPRNISRSIETFPKHTPLVCPVATRCASQASAFTQLSLYPPKPEEGDSSQACIASSFLQGCHNSSSLSVVSQSNVDSQVKRASSIQPVTPSPSSARKEVLLFGANLNAPVGEHLDRIKQRSDRVDANSDQSIICTLVSPAAENDQISLCSEGKQIALTAIQESEKDVILHEVLKCDVQALDGKELSNCDEHHATVEHLVKEPMSLGCEFPVSQVRSELPSVKSKELYNRPSNGQRIIVPAQVRQTSSHGVGAHTWHRGTSSTGALVDVGNVLRPAYVRKGNSLVRAPGAVSTLHPATDVRPWTSATSGPAMPFNKPISVRPNPFRSTFKANLVHSKAFLPAHRKYIAPPTQSDVVFSSVVRPAKPVSVPHSSGGFCMLSLPSSVVQEGPQNLSSKTSPLKAGSIPTPCMDRQTAAFCGKEFPLTDRSFKSLSPSNGGSISTSYVVQERAAVRGDESALTDQCEAALSRLPNFTSWVPQTPCPTTSLGIAPSIGFQMPVHGNRWYVRKKANQLVVAPQLVELLSSESQASQAMRTGGIPGFYFKRKTNQLVRSSDGEKGSSETIVQDVLENARPPDGTHEHGGGSTLALKKRLGRVLRQKKARTGRSSWVWTLGGGAAVGNASDFAAQHLRTEPLLFPWKRQSSMRTNSRSQRLKLLSQGKKGSLLFLMSKRFRKVQPVQPVYTRSADGFSLHRSGVMSLGGGNLKWTKSLEKRAKQASEAATKAVAEAERRKREKKEQAVEATASIKAEKRAARKVARGEGGSIVWVGLVRYKMDADSKTLQRVPESHERTGYADTTAPTGSMRSPALLTPRSSIIGGTPYLRVGNGNQLVRDPKAASRALASEKVRWSLHNARSRGAKRQQYCQFFTKFGKCNKDNGKCSYIHDTDKVAVCTKFLKGTCVAVQCLLTHKVIPERMPDCLFFLEGLCKHENCSYRHVIVNPKAPYCDGFLRGYCKDGDKCNKKHTYVCPVYAETGDCLVQTTCKFHHPKKKVSLAPAQNQEIGTKRKRRYFSEIQPDSSKQKVSVFVSRREDLTEIDNGDPGQGFLDQDFISLSNFESDDDQNVDMESQTWAPPGLSFEMKGTESGEDFEKWLRPPFLLQPTPAPTVAH